MQKGMEPMSETIEIEFKNMLTKKEYEVLLNTFKITSPRFLAKKIITSIHLNLH